MNRLAFSLLLAAMLCACDKPRSAAPGPSGPAGAAPGAKPAGAKAAGAATTGKIKFKAADPAKAFSIKLKEDGAKLVDNAEAEVARIRMEPDGKVKVKDAADKPLAYITGAAPQWHVKNAAQDKVLFQLVRQDDGDLKLEDGDGKLLFRIKKRDYGAEVETPDDRSMFKSKLKGGKLSIRDAAEKTLFSSNDAPNPQAAALLFISDLTMPQRVGLWYALEHPATAAPSK